jgi:hypothetical protein
VRVPMCLSPRARTNRRRHGCEAGPPRRLESGRYGTASDYEARADLSQRRQGRGNTQRRAAPPRVLRGAQRRWRRRIAQGAPSLCDRCPVRRGSGCPHLALSPLLPGRARNAEARGCGSSSRSRLRRPESRSCCAGTRALTGKRPRKRPRL